MCQSTGLQNTAENLAVRIVSVDDVIAVFSEELNASGYFGPVRLPLV
jgi:hypothetical protein